MFQTSLRPSSGDRLYKTASGVSLDVPAADCVESGHELSALSPEDGHNDARTCWVNLLL